MSVPLQAAFIGLRFDAGHPAQDAMGNDPSNLAFFSPGRERSDTSLGTEQETCDI